MVSSAPAHSQPCRDNRLMCNLDSYTARPLLHLLGNYGISPQLLYRNLTVHLLLRRSSQGEVSELLRMRDTFSEHPGRPCRVASI